MVRTSNAISTLAGLIVGCLLLGCVNEEQVTNRGAPPVRESAGTSWQDWRPPEVKIPDDNACRYYRNAWLEYSKLDVEKLPPELSDMSDNELRLFVALHARVFEQLERALVAPCRWPSASVEDLLAPEFAFLGTACAILVQRSVWREREGDIEGAIDNATSCVVVGSHATTRCDLMAGMIARGPDAAGIRRLNELLPSLNRDHCMNAVTRLSNALRMRATVEELLGGEVVSQRTTLQYLLATPERQLAADLGKEGVDVQAVDIDKERTWILVNAYFEQVLEEAKKPWSARQAPELPADPVSRFCVQQPFSRLETISRDLAKLRLTLAKLASRAYLLDHKTPLASPEALCPDYMSTLPVDPFTGKQIHFAFRGNKLLIYSLGPDGVEGAGPNESPSDDIVVSMDVSQ